MDKEWYYYGMGGMAGVIGTILLQLIFNPSTDNYIGLGIFCLLAFIILLAKLVRIPKRSRQGSKK